MERFDNFILSGQNKLSLLIGVIPMSLIACTSDCVYQQDGYCSLERAVSRGLPSPSDPCVHFVPRCSRRASKDSRQNFPNIPYAD